MRSATPSNAALSVRLSAFINTHVEEILVEWEAFSRRRVPEGEWRSDAGLRDHLGELLNVISRDLETPRRTERARAEPEIELREKAHVETVGEKHGAGRAEQGFTLAQTTAEFPLLRSCVMRLWLHSRTSVSPDDIDDLARFNEAIDVALRTSVSQYVERIDRSKEMFLGILGHDLRNPISAIVMSAKLMLEMPDERHERRELAKRIVSIGERMHHMVGDLLDFTRSRLGGQIAIERHSADLAKTMREAADEFTTAHPDASVRVEVAGDFRGHWDDERIRQVLGNLLDNAMHHGAKDAPIDLSARSEANEATIAVHNEGPPIPEERHAQIFEPLTGAHDQKDAVRHDPNHLGLGLYIAREIVRAHEGRIDVQSSAEGGTTFTIHLPIDAAWPSSKDV
jgi:signal transduction histidine kinase